MVWNISLTFDTNLPFNIINVNNVQNTAADAIINIDNIFNDILLSVKISFFLFSTAKIKEVLFIIIIIIMSLNYVLDT